VADQVDVAPPLDAHHTDEPSSVGVPPERDALLELTLELGGAHVGLVPAVLGDDAAVRRRCLVDDRENGAALVVAARADVLHAHESRPVRG
jgi:hypothetical protein